MQHFKQISILSFLVISLSACSKLESVKQLEHLDHIPQNQFYNEDPVPDIENRIYGVWKATFITQGGVTGSTTLPKDFDYLVIKPNGIFGIITNDELVTSGRIVVLETNFHTIQFDPEDSELEISILQNSDQVFMPTYNETENELSLNYGQRANILERVLE